MDVADEVLDDAFDLGGIDRCDLGIRFYLYLHLVVVRADHVGHPVDQVGDHGGAAVRSEHPPVEAVQVEEVTEEAFEPVRVGAQTL